MTHFINHSDTECRRNLHTAGLTRLSSSSLYINLLNRQALWSSPLSKTAPLAEGQSLIIPRGCVFFSAGLPRSFLRYKNDISNTGLLAHWITCSIKTSVVKWITGSWKHKCVNRVKRQCDHRCWLWRRLDDVQANT